MGSSALNRIGLRRVAICLMCACTLIPAAAHAGDTADAAALPDSPAAAANLPKAQLANVLASMLRDERVYAGNPDFDYMLGVVALKAEANTIALHALERVVLQSPERAGAWVDLAIAHARLGEIETAATLLDYVEQTFSAPPPLRTAIDQARQQLLAMRLVGGWHGEISANIGFDSNANSGLSIDRLTLTVDGTPAEFLIAPEYRVRSDAFTQWSGRLRRTWDTTLADTPGRFTFTGTARIKDYRNEKNFNLGDTGFTAIYQQPALGGETELSGGTQQIRLGGESLVNIQRLQLTWGQRLTDPRSDSGCRAQAGPEYELRSYTGRHYLDGSINWLGAQVICSSAGSDTAISLKAGDDEPRELRPGGRTQRSELTLVHRTTLWQQFGAEFSLSAARGKDADGYSPVLQDNSRRHIDRYYANASIYWPVSNGVDALASIELTRQDSNIAIFDQNGRVFMLGARYRF